MKRVLLAALMLAAVGAMAAEAEKSRTDGGMVTKAFDVLPTFLEKVRYGAADAEGMRAPGIPFEGYRDDIKEFYRGLGVDWPEGSSIRYAASIGKLIVKNTPENMAKLEEIIKMLNVPPTLIEVEADFLQFPAAAIEPLVQKGAVTADSLRDLWKSGKGYLLASPILTTLSGQEATVKGVKEYIYPTEFTVVSPSTTNAVGTNRAAAIMFKDSDVTAVAEPGGFETREVGALMTVLPEITPDDSLINLTMTPQYVCDPNWKDYGFEFTPSNGTPRKVRMEMPFFCSYTVTTSLMIRNGQTMIMGGGVRSQDGQNLVFILVTARKVDTSGKPVATKE